MCGIVGVYSLDGTDNNLLDTATDLLRGNKNRGQNGYGLSVLFDTGDIKTFKFEKLNKEVKAQIESIKGNIIGIIGHARYPTSGGSTETNTEYNQPFELNHLKYGMAFAFNGNIVNAEELAIELEESEGIEVQRPILDTNVLKFMILSKVKSGITDLQEILEYVNSKIDGACNIVLLSKNGNIAFSKDKWGIRPLSWEILDGNLLLSSESSALFKAGGDDTPNFVSAREIVKVDIGTKEVKNGIMNIEKAEREAHCFFESVYFTDPKTILWLKSASLHRYRLGQELAKNETENFSYKDTVVIDIPKSSLYSAQGYSETLDLQLYGGPITVNPNIGRTFTKTTGKRKEAIDKKYIFNPNWKEFVKGKKVILIDDSIVRGSTMKGLVKDFMNFYKPSEIHLRIPSPVITSPCYYGINMAEIEELVVRKHFKDVDNPTEIELADLANHFGAKSLKYIGIDGLIKALRAETKELCLACINSDYPTKGGRKKYQSQLEIYNAKKIS